MADPTPQPLQTDLAANYLAARIQMPEQAAGDSLLKEMQGEPAGTPQAPATAPQGAPQAPTGSPSFMQRTGAAAKDIALGSTVQAPRAIYTGARDAVQNTYDMIDDFAKWGQDKIGAATGFYGVGFKGGPHLESKAEADAPDLSDEVRSSLDTHTVADPTTTTGKLIQGVSQFLTGLALTNRALPLPMFKGAAGYGISALKGAAANFAAFDPHQQRLSNLIERFPALSNPVTQFLQSKPGDSNAEGRFKNALEGLGLGVLADGMVKGVRLLRGVMDAKSATQGAGQAVPATVPGTAPNAFRQLGDERPDAPLVSDKPISAQPQGEVKLPGQQPGTIPGPGESAAAGVEPQDIAPPAVPVTHEVDETFEHTVKSPNGQMTAQETGPYLQVKRSDVTEAARGGGEGMAMLERLSQEADARGLKLASDQSVSPDAQRLYRRLEDRGYIVTRNPSETNPATGNLVSLDPRKPVFEVSPGANAKPPEGRTYINFARIDSPEDVESTIQQLADKYHGSIEEAQRGKQTFEQIKLNADAENAWDVLKSRRVGEPLNAEQSVAARQLWASSADKVRELAQTAVASPTPENLFAFRKMVATHYAIQSEVIGARTETARALASWRIPVGSSASRLQDIAGRLMDYGGGPENVRLMAQQVSQLAGMPHELDAFVQKSMFARTRDALIQAFSDGLLTSPVTQAKILASNVTTGLWRVAERYGGSKVSQLLGTANGVSPGEASAMWSGWIGGFKDSLAYAGKALRTGVTGEGIGEPHEPRPSYISGNELNLGDHPWLGRAADFIGNALSAGRRGIATQHDMALTMAYRGELNAQAVRQATSELNAGHIAGDGFNDRVAELMANPTEAMTQTAKDSAKYQAFLDEPGKIAQWLLDGRRQIPALRIIAPFIKIPARIMSYTFERTPLAFAMKEFQTKLAAGGATRDLALAQMAMGTMVTMAAADMTMSGNLRGGGSNVKGVEQAEEREGAMRDSLRIGDKWYNINGVHPIGKLMLLAADVAENVTQGQTELHDPEEVGKILMGTTMAIARTMVDNSYFQGVANLFAAVHDANVKGGNTAALLSTAGGAVPAVSGAVARAGDPYQRAVYSMLDEFKSKIPGLSETLPPRRDLWGDPVPSGHDPITNLLSPVQVSNVKRDPIDDEIVRQGFNIEMPNRQQTFGMPGSTVAIDMSKYPQAYSRLLELSGHELKSPAWGVGLHDLLNSVVSGTHPLSAVYRLKSDGPDGGKEVMIRDLIAQYRDMAKRQVLKEFPALQSEVQQKQEAQRALKLGAMAQ